MTEDEYLLTCLAEEAAEVAQRATKALRFGAREVQPGQPLTNAERLGLELADLDVLAQLCQERGLLIYASQAHFAAKRERVKKYMAYSRSLGRLD